MKENIHNLRCQPYRYWDFQKERGDRGVNKIYKIITQIFPNSLKDINLHIQESYVIYFFW